MSTSFGVSSEKFPLAPDTTDQVTQARQPDGDDPGWQWLFDLLDIIDEYYLDTSYADELEEEDRRTELLYQARGAFEANIEKSTRTTTRQLPLTGNRHHRKERRKVKNLLSSIDEEFSLL